MDEIKLQEIEARAKKALPDVEGPIVVGAVIDSAHDVPALLLEIRTLRGLNAAQADALGMHERLVKNAEKVAEQDGLERRELQRVVNAAKCFIENDDPGDEDRLFGDLEETIVKLTPTSAKGLALEYARGLVIREARGYFEEGAGDLSALALALDALKLEELKP